MWGYREIYNLIKVLLWTTIRFIRGFSYKIKEVPQTVRLDGKVAIITGANTGIGYETALDFAKRGATVIVACRDETKGKSATDKIKKESKNDKVEYIQLDLNSLTSVRQFASDFRKRNLPLHILVNNAGIMNLPKRTETADGFEAQFGVNHLGHFLLTNLLLDILKSSAPARIINVSSSMHFGGEIRWDDINYKKGYNPVQSYSNSKVANVIFSYELAKRLEGTGVTVNAIHPGSVDTELTRYNEVAGQATIKKMIFRTPHEGALTQIWVAVSPEAEKVTGKFWSDCGIVDSCALSYDEKTQKKLWEISAQMVNLK